MLAGAFLSTPPARGAEPEWHSEAPVAVGVGVPSPVGEVGDLECLQANRCVLITKGNGGLPGGIYAYDGVEWHLYSTVCGAGEGRIAWAGPDDFWTVSDYATPAEGNQNPQEEHARTLC